MPDDMPSSAATAMPAPGMAEIRQQAAEWLIQLSDAESEAQRTELQAACQAWQQQHPQHAEIFRQMHTLWQSLADHADTAKPKRSKGRKALLGTALSALLLVGGMQMPITQYWLADEHTATGEIREIRLSDGSRITLNTHSAVDIRFDAHTRTIRLTKGEVLAQVAHDAGQRPFIVENRDGTATALGTRYLVRQDANSSTVTVLESTVAVKPRDGAMISKVHAGQQLRFDTRQTYPLMPAPTLAGSWQMKRLVFEDAPLSAVIARLAEYRPGLLRLRAGASALRFTGVLPTDDSDAALSILQQALPIRIQRYSQYLVLVDPTSLPTATGHQPDADH